MGLQVVYNDKTDDLHITKEKTEGELLRKLLAIWITKILIIIGKIAGKKGSSTPGAVALKICPDIIKRLSSQIPSEHIVAVCGTNGKTTTNNLLYSMITSEGKKAVCNNVGANMIMGVATAFVDSANIFGKIKAEYAAIEIDEVSAQHVFKQLKPGYMIITNFFRDQLDRYGEIDITMNAVKKALDMHPDIQLVLNADDPLVAWFGKGHKCHFYGVGEKVLGEECAEIKEGRFCKECGNELEYEYYHYSQLGKYRCSKCGFQRPRAEFEASDVRLEKGIEFTVNNTRISVNYRGYYNIYNILAAYGAAKLMGIKTDNINRVLGAYKPQIGRMESFYIGKDVVFNLSKNPAGFNQAITTMLEDPRKKDMLFVLNDNAQDGRDISWIWDVDFERMKGRMANCGSAGIRHNDLMVRYKYGGFDVSSIKEFGSVEQGIREMLKTDSPVLYVLVNYTALFSTQNILKRLEEEAKGADKK